MGVVSDMSRHANLENLRILRTGPAGTHKIPRYSVFGPSLIYTGLLARKFRSQKPDLCTDRPHVDFLFKYVNQK